VQPGYIQRSQRAPVKQSQVSKPDIYDDDEFDDVWPPRMPSSVRRYHSDVKAETGRASADVQSLAQNDYLSNTGRRTTIPPRRTATQAQLPALQPSRRRAVDTEDDFSYTHQSSSLDGGRRLRLHWLVYVGGAMLIMMLGWMALSAFANWWQVTQDDWHYGRPRTFQIDAVVGHDDSPQNPSHFIALNLRGHVEIIEFPGGDASKAKVYIGPDLVGPGQDLAPVTLSFKDVNGDGKLDMIATVQSSRFIFINDHGAFRPARPGEYVQPGS
jgi:hypothetical protein